jgi:hypothetical protein
MIHLYMHIFRRIFLSNYWWQESDIWSQASLRYAILWEAFLDPSDSYFLFADLHVVSFYAHWTYMHIFRHIFLSNYWWQRSDICHKLHMTFQEIRIIATGPCIANQLQDVNTICRRSWYIAAHVWKCIFRYQDLVEIYSVSAETIISDAFSYSENV